MDLETAERRLTRREAAAFLSARGYRVAENTLMKYATVGGGPVYEKFGRRALYTESTLLAWAASKTTRGAHTSAHDRQMTATNCPEAANG
jgi:hypothetical protein